MGEIRSFADSVGGINSCYICLQTCLASFFPFLPSHRDNFHNRSDWASTPGTRVWLLHCHVIMVFVDSELKD